MYTRIASSLQWWGPWLALLAALAIFAAQALIASPQKSASFDEQYHLAAGYAYLRTGDFRLATNHPPLMGLIGGLPLLARSDVALPTEHPTWQSGDRFAFSEQFLWRANGQEQANAPALLHAARTGIIVVGLLLVTALFLWARQLFGPRVAVWVLPLAALDPNLVSNARLVTTDLGLTAFLLLATWWLWRWLERPSLLNLLGAGAFAGLAMSAKYTGLLFWPIAVLICLLYPLATNELSSDGRRWEMSAQRALGVAGMGAVAVGVLWAVFGFDVGPASTLPLGVAANLPVPAPFYWTNLWNTYRSLVDPALANQGFLLGQVSSEGWWYYFPVVLAVKTPLSVLILLIGGLWLAMRKQRWRHLSVLWLPPLAFLALGMTGVLTIGYRHVLPAIPFVLLLASLALYAIFQQGRAGKVATVMLTLWLAASTLRLFPHQEAYFNEMAGAWPNWSHIVVDSNLDWGQDLPALRQIMAEHDIERVNLAYFGKGVPEQYGVSYHPLPGYLNSLDGDEIRAFNPYTPAPGWYAISATSLRLGLLAPGTENLYAFFQEREPDLRAGYSLYLYHIDYPAETAVERVRVIEQPVAEALLPLASTLSNEMQFAPAVAPAVAPAFASTDAAESRVQTKWVQTPETLVYPLGEGFTLPASTLFRRINADFEGVFTLLGVEGATAVEIGQPVTLRLYWRVGSQPMPMPAPTVAHPLSAFVHLTHSESSDIIAQFDGWRTALRGLEPTDIIVHEAALVPSDEAAPGDHTLHIGLYSPQSGARLHVVDEAGHPVADHADAGTIQLVAPSTE